MFRPVFFTYKPRKLLPYFFLQLSHCHVLKLLLGSAQVDLHLVSRESRNNNLVVLLHFVLTCVSLAVFLKLLPRTLVMALQVVVHDLGLISDEWRYSSTVIIGGIEGVTSKGWKKHPKGTNDYSDRTTKQIWRQIDILSDIASCCFCPGLDVCKVRRLREDTNVRP